MKKLYIISCVILLAVTVIGCGAATAPPVELPAPVVGRITISSPDASGKSLITGTEGAVTGGSIVMAINDSLTTASILWRISDTLVSKVYAQQGPDLPAICNEPGHYCVVANEDGSFELLIDAAVGDNIILVLIDEFGNEISDRIVLVVPEIDLDVSSCAGLGLEADMVDLLNVTVNDSREIAKLFEGNDDFTNAIALGSFNIQIPGCYAKSMIAVPGAISRAVVISDEDGIVWVADIVNRALVNSRTFELDDKPLAGAYIGQSDRIALVLETPNGIVVAKFSIVTGVVESTINIGALDPGYSFENLVGLKTIGPFPNNGYLGALMLKATATGLPAKNYVLLFETETPNFRGLGLFDLEVLIKTPVEDIADFELALNNISLPAVLLLVSDRGNELFRQLQPWNINEPVLSDPIEGTELTTLVATLLYDPAFDIRPISAASVELGNIAISYADDLLGTPAAYVLISDGVSASDLWIIGDYTAIDPELSIELIPNLSDSDYISTNQDTKSIAFGNVAGQTGFAPDSFWWGPGGAVTP